MSRVAGTGLAHRRPARHLSKKRIRTYDTGSPLAVQLTLASGTGPLTVGELKVHTTVSTTGPGLGGSG